MRAIDVIEAVRMAIAESADGENGADMATLQVLCRKLERMARIGRRDDVSLVSQRMPRCSYCDRYMTGDRSDVMCPASSGTEQLIPCRAEP